MSNSTDLVLLAVTETGVGVITLNNPDRMNAWSAAMSKRFFERLAECRANPDVRVVVITGAGKGFCPGADMDALNQIAKDMGYTADELKDKSADELHSMLTTKAKVDLQTNNRVIPELQSKSRPPLPKAIGTKSKPCLNNWSLSAPLMKR